MSAAVTARRGIPEATVARLPGYLRALTSLARDGIASVSSEELATAAGVSSTMLRMSDVGKTKGEIRAG